VFFWIDYFHPSLYDLAYSATPLFTSVKVFMRFGSISFWWCFICAIIDPIPLSIDRLVIKVIGRIWMAIQKKLPKPLSEENFK
jgi:hypothetical protein